MGPWLFLILLNDLSVDTSSGLFKYMDNTTVYKLVKNKGNGHAQHILDDVPAWAANNMFQLHPCKCVELRVTFAW